MTQELSSTLTIKYDLDHLCNDVFCQHLTNDIANNGLGWRKININEDFNVADIPNELGVYMFIWQPAFEIATTTNTAIFRQILYVNDCTNGNKGLRERFSTSYLDAILQPADTSLRSVGSMDIADVLKRVLNAGILEYWYLVMKGVSPSIVVDVKDRLYTLFNPPAGVTRHVTGALARELTEPAF